VIEVDLPESAAPEVVRSFAACLAAATETPVADVPLPDADLRGAVAHWRSWLAGRGAGLVPIARPRGFTWPGYWLAVLDADRAALMFGSPSGVVLSPQDPSLLGRASSDLPVLEGYVVAGLDPATAASDARPSALEGTVVAVAVAASAGAPMAPVDRARALAGRGLEGDRYAARAGTFTPADETLRGYDLTLVDADALSDLDLVDARRNVVTRGIDLDALVGRRFLVGDVECIGQRACEPCARLEALTRPGVLRGLIHRGGLRADVLSDGVIEVGAPIRTVD
jgi:hypothetical protein